ncbi:MAG: DUF433 domain-containing protein [Dehalococcoidia bacterium]
MVTATPVEIGSLLYRKKGFRSGRPCLAGTGMTVHTIAALHRQGRSAEQILEEDFPHLDLPRIYAAITYYLANQDEVESDMAADREWGEAVSRLFPDGWRGEPLPPELQKRLD